MTERPRLDLLERREASRNVAKRWCNVSLSVSATFHLVGWRSRRRAVVDHRSVAQDAAIAGPDAEPLENRQPMLKQAR
jgi:hypothetical protein